MKGRSDLETPGLTISPNAVVNTDSPIYQQLRNGKGQTYEAVPWEVLARHVTVFNQARTAAEKARALQALLAALEPYRGSVP